MAEGHVVTARTCIAPLTAGPLTGYRNYNCRCYNCAAANSGYEQRRRSAIQAGTWQPQVNAGPVIEHLRALRVAGVGSTKVAKAAGLPPHLVVRYVSDTSRPLPVKIRTDTAARLLKVTARDAMAASDRVPALGSRRRAHALAALGWSITEQAAQLGMPQSAYSSSINRAQVTSARAHQIADLYERLSGTLGPSDRARALAETHGWAPPLAWDDDDLDNPLARPSRTGRRAEVCSRGHRFTPETTRVHPINGRRICVTCDQTKSIFLERQAA